jgi:hypothetical protein
MRDAYPIRREVYCQSSPSVLLTVIVITKIQSFITLWHPNGNQAIEYSGNQAVEASTFSLCLDLGQSVRHDVLQGLALLHRLPRLVRLPTLKYELYSESFIAIGCCGRMRVIICISLSFALFARLCK